MAFADVKENQSLKRDVLVRIEHARDITDTLVLDTGLTYEVAYPFDPIRVEEFGVSRSHAWDGTTLSVTLIAAPSSTNPVIAYTNVYLTGKDSKYLDKDDPTGAITNVVEWLPRITTPPRISQNITNILEGTLSITSSSLIVSNSDGLFNEYVKKDNSFYNNTITIWFGLDDNYIQVFVAKVSDLSKKQTTLSFRIKDALKELNQTAYLGDDKEFCVATEDDYPELRKDQEGAPIRFYFGSHTTHTKIPISDGDDSQKLSFDDTDKFITYKTESGYNNQEFLIGRIRTFSGEGAHTPTAQTSVSWNSASTVTRLTLSAANVLFYTVEGLVSIEQPATVFTDYIIADINYESGYVFLTTLVPGTVVSIEKHRNTVFYTPDKVLHSNYSPTYSTVTTNGSRMIEIVNYTALPSLKTQLTTGSAATSRTDPHSDTLKFILEKSGISVNDDSFTDAESDFVANVMFSIPNKGERKFGPLLKYVNQITKSTFGYIFVNTSGEIEYKIVKALGTPSIIITETDIIDNSLSIKHEYQDIKTGYNVINSHASNIFQAKDYSEDSQSTILNGITDIYEEDTVLITNVSGAMSRKLDVLKNQRIIYSFNTAMKFAEINIGDEITLESDIVTDGSVDLLVTGYTKTIQSISITAMEIFI